MGELLLGTALLASFLGGLVALLELEVSRVYTTHQYGMMDGTANGHSFVLVGPDGTIDWRADYGGAPDYTMYLPTEKMLADLATERKR
jgi:hypothetical protein